MGQCDIARTIGQSCVMPALKTVMYHLCPWQSRMRMVMLCLRVPTARPSLMVAICDPPPECIAGWYGHFGLRARHLLHRHPYELPGEPGHIFIVNLQGFPAAATAFWASEHESKH